MTFFLNTYLDQISQGLTIAWEECVLPIGRKSAAFAQEKLDPAVFLCCATGLQWKEREGLHGELREMSDTVKFVAI